MFFGMQTMETALKPLAELPEFIDFIARFSKTPMQVFGGFSTSLIQSSSATIRILKHLPARVSLI